MRRASRHAPLTSATATRPPRGDQIPAASMIIAMKVITAIAVTHAMIRRANTSNPRSSPAIAAVGATTKKTSTSTVTSKDLAPARSATTPAAPAATAARTDQLVSLAYFGVIRRPWSSLRVMEGYISHDTVLWRADNSLATCLRRCEPPGRHRTSPHVYAAASAIAAATEARMDGSSRGVGGQTRANRPPGEGPRAWLDKLRRVRHETEASPWRVPLRS